MIKVIFATVTGNTQLVAEYIQKQLKSNREVELISAEGFEADKFTKEERYIIAASTWNLGEMNQFLEHIFTELTNVKLNGVEMAFVGLGDRIYGDEHFCKSIMDFRELALKQGAVELVEPLYLDGEPESLLDSEVKPWADQLKSKLN